MAIPEGFNEEAFGHYYSGPYAVDNRIFATKTEMKAMMKATMPDKYFCFCPDDKSWYIYDASISKSEAASRETGRFVLLTISKSNLEEAEPEWGSLGTTTTTTE